jgi:putative ATP-binding cassette transporter
VFRLLHFQASHTGTDSSATEEVDEWFRKLRLEQHVRLDGKLIVAKPLSQGQRKRLALLVAYLEDRSILVFDECAADRDQFFYKQCLAELREEGKTIIAVTHDGRYFYTAERIVKLDSGAIVDDIRV